MPAAETAFTSAGSKIFVAAAAPATFNAAGYAALTWTEIGEVVDIGEFGKEYELVTHNPLADGRTRKKKGSYNTGSVPLQMARVPGDDGHVLLLAGLDDYDPYSFKVLFQDGTINYFQALIMSYKSAIGSVNNITAASCNIEIDTDIVEVVPV